MEDVGDGEEQVAYSSTQALWSACLCAAGLSSELVEALGGVDVPALRAFYDGAVDRESELLPVANTARPRGEQGLSQTFESTRKTQKTPSRQ